MRGKHDVRVHRVCAGRIIPAHAGQTSSMTLWLVSVPDHPRACGANTGCRSWRNSDAGSSPRMRGKHFRHRDEIARHRIIPAHAGQTRTVHGHRPWKTDHPRACGANTARTMTPMNAPGSSPRMRGKQEHPESFYFAGRIIPAHAGQTGPRLHRGACRPDHPRACGANYRLMVAKGIGSGSSPRMRGKHEPHASEDTVYRIIPAHAGQTGQVATYNGGSPDHPRACGANFATVALRTISFGSSPRMRGKHRVVRTPLRDVRIIPAHAGQTLTIAMLLIWNADHPRACGANGRIAFHISFICGSSPRMRGKHIPHAGRIVGVRIIPAHAGQTLSLRGRAHGTTDHPRACGANKRCRIHQSEHHGSSPRMRGKRGNYAKARAADRIIPAHAGQTILVTHVRVHAADHPRACGANFHLRNRPSLAHGSSPRMRGKRTPAMPPSCSIRIIPAHAGQTLRPARRPRRRPDHPRACGANHRKSKQSSA